MDWSHDTQEDGVGGHGGRQLWCDIRYSLNFRHKATTMVVVVLILPHYNQERLYGLIKFQRLNLMMVLVQDIYYFGLISYCKK